MRTFPRTHTGTYTSTNTGGCRPMNILELYKCDTDIAADICFGYNPSNIKSKHFKDVKEKCLGQDILQLKNKLCWAVLFNGNLVTTNTIKKHHKTKELWNLNQENGQIYIQSKYKVQSISVIHYTASSCEQSFPQQFTSYVWIRTVFFLNIVVYSKNQCLCFKLPLLNNISHKPQTVTSWTSQHDRRGSFRQVCKNSSRDHSWKHEKMSFDESVGEFYGYGRSPVTTTEASKLPCL